MYVIVEEDVVPVQYLGISYKDYNGHINGLDVIINLNTGELMPDEIAIIKNY